MPQLGGGFVEPLQGKAGAEQGGLLQGFGQPLVEIPEQALVWPGQGVLGQQLGAEIQLQHGLQPALPAKGLADQAAAGTQVGPGACGGDRQGCAEMGQPPGHPLLQAGLAGIGAGVAAEAGTHPLAEGGRAHGRASIQAHTMPTRAELSRQCPTPASSRLSAAGRASRSSRRASGTTI